MKNLYLTLAGVCFLFTPFLNAQTVCPDGFESTILTDNATLYEENSVGDKDRANGAPNGDFAKLDNSSDYLILKLNKPLESGLQLSLYFATYDNDPATGTIAFSENGTTFGSPIAFGTSIKKPSTAINNYSPSQNVQFVRIKRTSGKLLIDAIVAQYRDCRFSPLADKNVITCYNTAKYVCLNDLLPADGAYNYTLSVENNPLNGILNVADNTLNLCSEDNPAELTFVYNATACDNAINEQDGDKCTDFYAMLNQVYIKVTDDNDPAKSNPKTYFEGQINKSEFFTAKSMNVAQSKFPRDIYVHIYNVALDTVLQTIKLKADCGGSNPFYLQNSFGGVLLTGYKSKNGFSIAINPYCEQQSIYTPDDDFFGVDNYTIKVCDLKLPTLCRTANIGVQVLDSNSPSCIQTNVKKTAMGMCPNTPKQICLDDLFGLTGNSGVFGNTSNGYDIHFLNNNQDLNGTLITNEASGENCCSVNGKPTSLSFAYVESNLVANSQPSGKSSVTNFSPTNGNSIYIVVNNSSTDTFGTVYYKGGVNLNQKFTASSTSFSSNTYIHLYSADRATLLQRIQFHTSCSAPIIIGEQFGYLVLKESGNSTGSCGGGTPPEPDCCSVNGKPTSLTFKYALTNTVANTQPSGKSSVTTFYTPKFEKVYVVVNSNSSDTSGSYYFKGYVNPSKLFTAAASSFSSNTYFHILTATRDTLIQRVQFHTSCSAPIIPGEQFGLLQLTTSANANGSCGYTVQCKNQITYFPPSNYQGNETIKLLVCVTGNNDQVNCDTAEISMNISSIAPIALNDTIQNLPTTSSTYNSVIDVLANDYHVYKAPFAIQSPLVVNPSSASGSAIINDQFKIEYTNSNVTNGLIDSFTYRINTDCSCDTAKVYLAFGGPVPVTWLDITAKAIDNSFVKLNWQTASELTNLGFDVERSSNGIDFHKIDFVKGNGTTSSLSSYEYFDLSPFVKDNYYRLKQMDQNGEYSYSKTVVASLSNIGNIQLWPNPSNGNINLAWTNNALFKGEVNIEITTYSGQVIYSETKNAMDNSTIIHLENIRNGMYLINIATSVGETYTKKVVLIK